mgnify:CR=1 FL=1|jgi:hypothetical protein
MPAESMAPQLILKKGLDIRFMTSSLVWCYPVEMMPRSFSLKILGDTSARKGAAQAYRHLRIK